MPVSPKSIAIIGAGMAGLSAGCYAQMNGFSSQVFELHYLPGGLCTSWRRGPYTFDGGVRLLSSVNPATPGSALWKELGLLEGRAMHFYDEFTRYEGRDGRTFILYTDIDRLHQHMLELSPGDEDAIDDFCRALHAFRKMNLPVDITPAHPEESLEMGKAMLPLLGAALRWARVTASQFAAAFKDPLLREALPQFFQLSRPDFPMMLMLSSIAMMHDREAGYPLGGSLALAEALARRYEALGGQIHYRARVTQILVEDDRAAGVRTEDGAEHHSDLVISACDGRTTLFDLLDARYLDQKTRDYYTTLHPTSSLLQISLGVDRDFSAEPPSVSFAPAEPLLLGNLAQERLVVKHYSFDPSMAPAGKAVLSVWCEADYAYWKALHPEPERYRAAKEAAAQAVIRGLDARYPGLAAQVEVIDVATPMTYERYTANWRGAFAGWAMTTRKMSMMMGQGMKRTLPGLDNFAMIGQWVEPGGNVELAAGSGRDVIKDICEAEERPFLTAA
jgi:phytoene dehydrogenase-like protein